MVGTTSKGARRRLEVLEAARALLIDGGLDRFSMRGVAESMDTKLANVQYYFPTRDDLLEAVVDAESVSDLDALQLHDGAARDELRRIVALLLSRWFADPGRVYLPLGVLAQRDDRFARAAERIWARFYAALVPVVQRVAPDVTAEEAHARAVMITSLIDGASFQPYPSAGPSSREAMSRRVAEAAVSIAQHG